MVPILSLLLVLPLVFACVIGFAPAKSARTIALAGALLTFAVSLLLLGYDGGALLPPDSPVTPAQATGLFRYVENVPWLPALGIRYHVGVDGPAMWLVLTTTLMHVLAVGISWNAIRERSREFYVLLTILETCMIGSFCALDLILFFVFFEACFVPIYFLIGIWGGKNRVYAATKTFLYTLFGSLIMLVAIFALYLYTRSLPGQTGSFDLLVIKSALADHPLGETVALFLFAAFMLAFAIKAPLFPLHTWLPDAYGESPVGVVIAGLLPKLATYGMLRFCLPLFPEASRAAAPVIITLAVISIIYGALVAAVQRDLKRLMAYSSVSHLGFVVLGLFSFTPQGAQGAMVMMVSHTVTTGAMFLLFGMLQERNAGRTRVTDFGGLWEQMPLMSRIFLIVAFSSIALPLTNGFVGEFLILVGAFQTFPVAASFATTGVIWSAVYTLWMAQRVLYGPVDKPVVRRMGDLSRGELALVLPLVALIFAVGIAPGFLLRKMDASLDLLLRNVTLGQEPIRYVEPEKIVLPTSEPQLAPSVRSPALSPSQPGGSGADPAPPATPVTP